MERQIWNLMLILAITVTMTVTSRVDYVRNVPISLESRSRRVGANLPVNRIIINQRGRRNHGAQLPKQFQYNSAPIPTKSDQELEAESVQYVKAVKIPLQYWEQFSKQDAVPINGNKARSDHVIVSNNSSRRKRVRNIDESRKGYARRARSDMVHDVNPTNNSFRNEHISLYHSKTKSPASNVPNFSPSKRPTTLNNADSNDHSSMRHSSDELYDSETIDINVHKDILKLDWQNHDKLKAKEETRREKNLNYQTITRRNSHSPKKSSPNNDQTTLNSNSVNNIKQNMKRVELNSINGTNNKSQIFQDPRTHPLEINYYNALENEIRSSKYLTDSVRLVSSDSFHDLIQETLNKKKTPKKVQTHDPVRSMDSNESNRFHRKNNIENRYSLQSPNSVIQVEDEKIVTSQPDSRRNMQTSKFKPLNEDIMNEILPVNEFNPSNNRFRFQDAELHDSSYLPNHDVDEKVGNYEPFSVTKYYSEPVEDSYPKRKQNDEFTDNNDFDFVDHYIDENYNFKDYFTPSVEVKTNNAWSNHPINHFLTNNNVKPTSHVDHNFKPSYSDESYMKPKRKHHNLNENIIKNNNVYVSTPYNFQTTEMVHQINSYEDKRNDIRPYEVRPNSNRQMYRDGKLPEIGNFERSSSYMNRKNIPQNSYGEYSRIIDGSRDVFTRRRPTQSQFHRSSSFGNHREVARSSYEYDPIVFQSMPYANYNTRRKKSASLQNTKLNVRNTLKRPLLPETYSPHITLRDLAAAPSLFKAFSKNTDKAPGSEILVADSRENVNDLSQLQNGAVTFPKYGYNTEIFFDDFPKFGFFDMRLEI